MTENIPATKPMWKRNKGACNQRVFNDPIDWEGHIRNCPHDIRQKLERLLESLKKLNLDERLEALEHADPVADPFAVEDSDPTDQRFPDTDEAEYDEHGFAADDEDEDDEQPRRELSGTDYFGGQGGPR